jgi:predicted Zn finger-like uncharacterized protein
MALVTLCPGCRTTFRVTPNQLKAHGGDVRCGQCQQVFNSFATLITVDESEIGELSGASSKALSGEKPDANADSKISSNLSSDSARSLSFYLNQEPATTPDPAYNFDVMPLRKIPRVWFLAGSVFLLASMVLTAFFYRAEISAAAPGTRPYFEGVCAILSCSVPYPQDIALLSIESSDLQVDPVKQPDVAKLIVIIRNHAPFPQALPALKLMLTNSHNQIVASHLYTAADYLGDEKDIAQVIGPGKEKNVQIDIENSDSNATGYRILLLYP